MASQSITHAAKIISHGGIVVYPTDTAYAIGCDFQNIRAVNRILKIKKRTKKQFTLIAASQKQVEKFFPLSPCQRALAKKYWPGPLSIVVSEQYAVRVPGESHARKIARAADTLLIATSANISGEKELYSLNPTTQPHRATTICHLQQSTNAILDIGELPHRLPSTVVECHNGKIIVHRQGAVIIPKKMV